MMARGLLEIEFSNGILILKLIVKLVKLGSKLSPTVYLVWEVYRPLGSRGRMESKPEES